MLSEKTKAAGGTHYSSMTIQPMEFCMANMTLEEFEGAMKWNIQKYCWRDKDQKISDIEKIKHYCDIWLERLNGCNSSSE